MNPIKQLLSKQSVMILDGAFSTELEKRGCDINDSLWSAKILIENPKVIQDVHLDYYKAGVDCVITASYQATYEGFAKRGIAEKEAEKLFQLSIKLAKDARDEFWNSSIEKTNRFKPLVAASIGPYGAYLADGSEYRGDYGLNINSLQDFHRKRLETLIAAGPDILACETIPCLDEAKALTRLLLEHQGTYGWFSFSAKDGEHINSGEKIYDCAKWLDQYEQVAAIGINCSPPEYMLSLIAEIKKGTNKPIILYPNSGEQYNADSKTWNGCALGTSYGENARRWYEASASIIGGCCRTTPDDIREIANWARSINKE